MERGVLYLVTVVDWYSRKVLTRRRSNTLEVASCVAALKETLAIYGPLETFDADHHPQRLVREAQGGKGEDMDGRQGPLDRQSHKRAPLAVAEIPLRFT